MRIRSLAAAAVLVLSSIPALAQERVGVPECDDFLTKYDACVASMPSASQPAMKDSITQMRTAWKAVAADAGSRAGLAQACKDSAESMKASMPNCKF